MRTGNSNRGISSRENQAPATQEDATRAEENKSLVAQAPATRAEATRSKEN